MSRREGPVTIDASMAVGTEFALAGLAGIGLYVSLLMWSRIYKTDGRIPRVMFESWRTGEFGPAGKRKLFDRVLKSGLIVRDGEDYRIPSYSACADTVADIERMSEQGKKRARAQRLRPSVIARDGLRCHLCGLEVDPCDVHIDHVHPLSRGGDSVLDNLRVAHSRCNIKKGAS